VQSIELNIFDFFLRLCAFARELINEFLRRTSYAPHH
jgi:hypothetical protein